MTNNFVHILPRFVLIPIAIVMIYMVFSIRYSRQVIETCPKPVVKTLFTLVVTCSSLWDFSLVVIHSIRTESSFFFFPFPERLKFDVRLTHLFSQDQDRDRRDWPIRSFQKNFSIGIDSHVPGKTSPRMERFLGIRIFGQKDPAHPQWERFAIRIINFFDDDDGHRSPWFLSNRHHEVRRSVQWNVLWNFGLFGYVRSFLRVQRFESTLQSVAQLFFVTVENFVFRGRLKSRTVRVSPMCDQT